MEAALDPGKRCPQVPRNYKNSPFLLEKHYPEVTISYIWDSKGISQDRVQTKKDSRRVVTISSALKYQVVAEVAARLTTKSLLSIHLKLF
jgi:hypothetical protein